MCALSSHLFWTPVYTSRYSIRWGAPAGVGHAGRCFKQTRRGESILVSPKRTKNIVCVLLHDVLFQREQECLNIMKKTVQVCARQTCHEHGGPKATEKAGALVVRRNVSSRQGAHLLVLCSGRGIQLAEGTWVLHEANHRTSLLASVKRFLSFCSRGNQTQKQRKKEEKKLPGITISRSVAEINRGSALVVVVGVVV